MKKRIGMHNKVNIAEILSRGWQIARQNKALWVISLLANCGAGIAMSLSAAASGLLNGLVGQNMPAIFSAIRPADFIAKYGMLVGLGIALLCALGLLAYYMTLIGRSALIKGIDQAGDTVETLPATSLRRLWNESKPYFWRMFWVDSVALLPLVVGLYLLAGWMWMDIYSAASTKLPFTAPPTSTILTVAGVLLCGMCVTGLLTVIFGWIVQMAYFGIALEDLGVMAALKRGWQVVKSAWLSILVLGVILGLINEAASLVIFVPLQFAVNLLESLAQNTFGAVPALILSFILYLPVYLIVTSLLQVYSLAVWTLFFRRLTSAPL